MELWIIVTSLLAILIVFVITFIASPKKKKEKRSPTNVMATTVRDGAKFTAQEVANHNRREDCWIIVENKVYDVTGYVDDHPGGDAILNNAGKDSTVGFKGPQHPASVIDVLKLYYIGDLE